ncbi:PulJ/GspJ family protein [Thermogemmata fonticola]|uniref:Prepilin-type N-terminal cleavage/methylation domain-containing protein n=1 Tax=Thermogemmata fonticola TaxID=2755323 RepID=A0A7V8VDI6_9BACT|nr:prepilin-type N-terminal cleavage/methylation domain-containing protein [Thermogemmata fonticola]MBA2225971.1 prepilin-type N-terminal cleavage/methylation domain-containing protein [Thermogemmata fonticola]
MIRNRNRHRRGGYTLVEVMVALGLSVLTMWILAEAFRIGLEMIGQARAQAQLMTQLSAVGNILHRDLVVAHPFLPDDNRPNRGLRLSDQRLDRLTASGQGWTPPPGGFFRIISPDSTIVQTDSEGLNIYSATNHALHFTAILPDNDSDPYHVQVDYGPAGIQVVQSRAAEIAYFLADTGNVTGAGGLPLYNLMRRQRLVAVDDNSRAKLWAPSGGVVPVNYTSLIASDLVKGPWTLQEIRHPSRRLPLSPVTIPVSPSGSPYPLVLPVTDAVNYGTDILLSNVLSFEVRVNWDPNPDLALNSSLPPRGLAQGNTEFPYDNLGSANPSQPIPGLNLGRNSTLPATFDTWHDETGWTTGPNAAFSTSNSPGPLPLAIRVKGIQITIRVFDPKTRSVRQNTWRFAL